MRRCSSRRLSFSASPKPRRAASNQVSYLPKRSYVVPFWVCYGFLVRDYSILPKKELHRRLWVGPLKELCMCMSRYIRGYAVMYTRFGIENTCISSNELWSFLRLTKCVGRRPFRETLPWFSARGGLTSWRFNFRGTSMLPQAFPRRLFGRTRCLRKASDNWSGEKRTKITSTKFSREKPFRESSLLL